MPPTELPEPYEEGNNHLNGYILLLLLTILQLIKNIYLQLLDKWCSFTNATMQRNKMDTQVFMKRPV